MIEYITRYLETVFQNDISIAFCLIIVTLLVVATALVLRPSLSQKPFAKSIVAIASGSMATIGVLGTFVGIFFGLLDFNVTDITKSVRDLLSGLKIAFSTSIAGIGSAIIFRFIRAIAPTAELAEGVSPSDIHRTLVDIRDHAKEIFKISKEQLAASERMHNDAREATRASTEQIADLRAAISSESDSSLLTQVQKLRTTTMDKHNELIDVLEKMHNDAKDATRASTEQIADLRAAISSESDGSLLTQMQKLRADTLDKQSELINAFRSFSDHMIENNQKAVIEALREVIQDFNKNLSEQVGESFKELSSAVRDLVNWQNNYKAHIEQTEQRLVATVGAIVTMKDSIKQIEESAGRIPEAVEPLGSALTELEEKTKLLNAHLESIAELRDKAIEAFPVIEGNLDKLTVELAASIERTLHRSDEIMNDARGKHDEISKSYASILEGIDGSRTKFSAELDKMLEEMASRTGDAVNNFISENAERFNQQFGQFDAAMKEELERVLGVLGRSLASIQEKYTEDYENMATLLERLRELDRRIGRQWGE